MITFKQFLLLPVLGKKELRLLSVVIFCNILINSQPSKYQRHLTAVSAGILRLSISMGNQFSTDYLATVGPILMRPKADPHKILILIQYWKMNPLVNMCAMARNFCKYSHSWFRPILVKIGFIFLWAIFSIVEKLLKVAGIEPKINLVHTNNPNIFTKGSKNFGWIVNSNLTSWQNMIVNIFLLGDTACWSWICCAAQFPHCDSEPVDGPLKMPQINGAKPQWCGSMEDNGNIEIFAIYLHFPPNVPGWWRGF